MTPNIIGRKYSNKAVGLQYNYRCHECGREYDLDPRRLVCSDCAAFQTPNLPLRGLLEVVQRKKPSSGRKVWDWLPVEKRFFPSIPVGNTPLWQSANLRRHTGFQHLFLKDDSLNPTGSLKDRASWLVAAMAQKHGLRHAFVASTGNAAASLAGVCAAAGIQAEVYMPRTAPVEKRVQVGQYGAQLHLVDGDYDAAFDESLKCCDRPDWICRNTALNPLTIEGKKTVSLEIYWQMGRQIPDRLFVAGGDGVILSGVYKGFSDLRNMGFSDRMPMVCCVQAEGSQALARAWQESSFPSSPPQSRTVADSIAVNVPRAGFLAVKKTREHGGVFLTVSDDEILSAQHELAAKAGLFAEPAAAAAFAGFLKIRAKLDPSERIVILITGHGLKDIASAQSGLALGTCEKTAIQESPLPHS